MYKSNAPHNFQIIPMEYGHSAHIELLFFFDRNLPDWQNIPVDIMQRSKENDITHGHHAATPPRVRPMAEKLGPLYSNFHVWTERIKNAFDPRAISNPSPR